MIRKRVEGEYQKHTSHNFSRRFQQLNGSSCGLLTQAAVLDTVFSICSAQWYDKHYFEVSAFNKPSIFHCKETQFLLCSKKKWNHKHRCRNWWKHWQNVQIREIRLLPPHKKKVCKHIFCVFLSQPFWRRKHIGGGEAPIVSPWKTFYKSNSTF